MTKTKNRTEKQNVQMGSNHSKAGQFYSPQSYINQAKTKVKYTVGNKIQSCTGVCFPYNNPITHLLTNSG